MSITEAIGTMLDRSLSNIPANLRYAVITNEPVYNPNFYKGTFGPIQALPNFTKKTIVNTIQQLSSDRRKEALFKHGISYKSGMDATKFIDRAVNNPKSLTRWDANNLLSQIMHNKYINEQFGTESQMINKALTGQVSTVSQKELLKSVHPKYHPLVKKGLDVWRTNPSTIYKLHDFLEYTQLYAPYSHPLNSMITNAARQNINFNSVEDIHKYIDSEAKRLKWSKNKVKELKSFTRGAVYNKNNKLMGFATHGGRKPLLLTGGVNNQFSVGNIKIGTRTFKGVTDAYDLMGLTGGTMQKPITIALRVDELKPGIGRNIPIRTDRSAPFGYAFDNKRKIYLPENIKSNAIKYNRNQAKYLPDVIKSLGRLGIKKENALVMAKGLFGLTRGAMTYLPLLYAANEAKKLLEKKRPVN